MAEGAKRVVLASPRGFCAGVDRAIAIVEQALARFGAPVYVRHEIVHNRHVVDRNRPIHTGAEAARAGQHNALGTFRHQPSAWAACSASTSRANSSLYSAITPIKINE